MARKFMSLIDEMNSIETSKHVKRTMIENARQNYWNGSVTPFGYRSVVADLKGQKQKKRLEIDPDTAETVRLIFRLYLDGDGQNGPLGIKNIVIYLNDRGYSPPRGARFRVGFIARILRAEIYTGRAWYNRKNARNNVQRPKDEWVSIEVPAIISEEDFRRADVQLTNRSPKVTAPRIVNSPVLLTGVARCGSCGSMLSRLTGKGGRYTYYRCSGKAHQGSCVGGKSNGISAPILDKIVLDKICDELLTPERVKNIVAEVVSKREASSSEAETSLGQLKAQRSKNLKKLQNLLDALAEGIVTPSDTFKASVKSTEDDCERLGRLIALKEAQLDTQLKPISATEAQVLASQLRYRLTTSTAPVQKRIIRSLVDSVVLTAEEIIITGPKSDLAEVVTGSPPTDLYQKGRI